MAEATGLGYPGVRDYEAIYILRPDIDAEAATKVSNRVLEVLAREGAKLVKVESWGRRKLAYPVRKYRRGVYVYLRFYGKTSLIHEFERNLRMLRDTVLKFMTIKVSDEAPDMNQEVNEEDVQFADYEPMTDEERDETREKLLGLIDPYEQRQAREGRGRRADRDDDDDMDDEEGMGEDDDEQDDDDEEGTDNE